MAQKSSIFTIMTYMVISQHETPAPRIMKLTILVDFSLFIIIIYLICLIHTPVQTRGEEILHFYFMVIPKHKNPDYGNHEIYNFGRLFLDYHYYTHPLGVERRFSKHYHFMTYTPTPQHKNPCPEGNEIYNLVDPSLFIITLNIVKLCLIYAWEQRRRFFKEKVHFH